MTTLQVRAEIEQWEIKFAAAAEKEAAKKQPAKKVAKRA